MKYLFFLAFMLTIVCYVSSVSSAYAAPPDTLTFSTPIRDISCDVGAPSSFAVKIIYCVKMAVFDTTTVFLAQTTALFMPVIISLMLLVLVLLGVRIATGERDPQKMVVAYLLKFGIVLLFSNNFGAAMGGLTDNVFLAMEEMQGYIIPVLYNGTPSSVCTLTGTGPRGGYIVPITYTPWEYIDCVFDYIFGFGKEATIASSLFGFIGSAFFGGYMGAMVFFLGIALFLSLALFAFRCVYITLMCYIMAGFLIVLSPFFIPTLMFKVTEEMFKKWLSYLIAAMFLPFMMVAYLGFAMPVLDLFVFGSDPQSLTSTLGRDDEVLEKYRLAAPICETSSPQDYEFFKNVPGYSSRILSNVLNPAESGSMDWCGMADFSKVDLGENHVQELWEIGMSLLRILVGSFLILTVAKVIPDITAHIVKGGFELAQAAKAPMLFENTIRGSMRSSMRVMGENAGRSTGIFGGAGNVMNMLVGRR